MPWRALPGRPANPYHVWLSEIMLQQTSVVAVIPYFDRFVARFPTVDALAGAAVDAVMESWAGLGYYARARNLHACARAVAALGGFPDTVEGLRALPGIGAYTAAAIASIAFGRPVVPVDGNVERVVARVYAIATPLPAARRAIADGAAQLGSDPAATARPPDFTQALFDLGATICTPRRPACTLCPWRDPCCGRIQGIAPDLPVKAPKLLRPVRHGAAFVLTDRAGRVWLRRRPPRGLLGGMLEVPSTPWRSELWAAAEAEIYAPAAAHAPEAADTPVAVEWQLLGTARHAFTHFELLLDVYSAAVADLGDGGTAVSELAGVALPTVMRRCLRVAGIGADIFRDGFTLP